MHGRQPRPCYGARHPVPRCNQCLHGLPGLSCPMKIADLLGGEANIKPGESFLRTRLKKQVLMSPSYEVKRCPNCFLVDSG